MIFQGFWRLVREFPGTAVFGLVVAGMLLADARFAYDSERVDAVVSNVTPGWRRGRNFADLVLRLDDGPTRADLKAWYTPLAIGQIVRVRYLPGNPDSVALDRLEHIYMRTVIGLACLGITAILEAGARRARRRRVRLDAWDRDRLDSLSLDLDDGQTLAEIADQPGIVGPIDVVEILGRRQTDSR